MSVLMDISNLTVRFGRKTVVDSLSLQIQAGERFALVGESGSGKTLTGLSLMGLLPEAAKVSGHARLNLDSSVDVLTLDTSELRSIRGKDVAMIFQEPMTALNPLYTVGNQIVEAVLCHEPRLSAVDAKQRAIALLERTGIAQPDTRFAYYPHQLSGGQRQRAMIAMALTCKPRLLIADEPTVKPRFLKYLRLSY